MTRKEPLWLALMMCVLMMSACSSLKKTSSTNKPQFLEGFTGTSNFKESTVKLKIITSGANLETAQLWQFKYAQMLDVPVEKVVNTPLYSFIEDWWATPYRLG